MIPPWDEFDHTLQGFIVGFAIGFAIGAAVSSLAWLLSA